jgi:MFS superfamily sulfate permease-like transporter
MVALFGVLVFEVLVGLVLAIIVAIALMVWRASRVGGSLMGHMPSVQEFRRISLYPEAKEIPGLKLFLIDGDLFYANSSVVKRQLKALVLAQPKPNMIAILMFETSHELDITSSRALESVIRVAQEERVEIVLAGVATMTLDSLRKAGIVDMIGEDHVIRDPRAVLELYERKYGPISSDH